MIDMAGAIGAWGQCFRVCEGIDLAVEASSRSYQDPKTLQGQMPKKDCYLEKWTQRGAQ